MKMDERARYLELDTRKKIYSQVERAPGIHFRELQRRTDLAIGSLQYHLDVLQKQHLVKSRKKGKFTRFFPVYGEQSEEEKVALSLFREESVRKIVLFLVQKKRATNKQLARFLGLAPSTVSFHMQKLIKAGLVEKKRRKKKTYFSLANAEQAKEIIIGYRKSFLDDLVDSFVEMWEGI